MELSLSLYANLPPNPFIYFRELEYYLNFLKEIKKQEEQARKNATKNRK